MKMAGRKVVVIWREEKWSGMPGKVWASPASSPANQAAAADDAARARHYLL